jgi:uncharacterized protein
MQKTTKGYLFMALGWLMLLLGLIGIVLPVLPTTPFVLFSAYFFSNGSKKIHQWLLDNKYFGNMIKDWEKAHIIRLKAKIYASIMIVPLISYTLIIVQVNISIKAIITIIALIALTYIWTRPSKLSEIFAECHLN